MVSELLGTSLHVIDNILMITRLSAVLRNKGDFLARAFSVLRPY